MRMGEAGDYRFIDHHGEMIGAVMNRMDGKQRPMWNYYFGVPDIDKAAEAVRANGGTITFGPQEIPGGEYAVNAVDPQGPAFGLVALGRAPVRTPVTNAHLVCRLLLDTKP